MHKKNNKCNLYTKPVTLTVKHNVLNDFVPHITRMLKAQKTVKTTINTQKSYKSENTL